MVYKFLEMTGYAAAGLSAIGLAARWVMSHIWAAIKRFEAATASLADVANINTNVKAILENHLPHIQTEVAETKQQFATVCSDINGLKTGVSDLNKAVIVLDTKQETTQHSLEKLGTLFVQHLDKSSGKE
jgi:septal ring factor EnvC (AmiA/AmiB activator)